jgi:hypothetical protein
MLNAVPATWEVVAVVTEKCVATSGGGWEAAPHPFRKHKQEIEIRTKRDFFMTAPQDRSCLHGDANFSCHRASLVV